MLGGEPGPLVWAGGANRRPLKFGAGKPPGCTGMHMPQGRGPGHLSALNRKYVPAGPDFQALFLYLIFDPGFLLFEFAIRPCQY